MAASTIFAVPKNVQDHFVREVGKHDTPATLPAGTKFGTDLFQMFNFSDNRESGPFNVMVPVYVTLKKDTPTRDALLLLHGQYMANAGTAYDKLSRQYPGSSYTPRTEYVATDMRVVDDGAVIVSLET